MKTEEKTREQIQQEYAEMKAKGLEMLKEALPVVIPQVQKLISQALDIEAFRMRNKKHLTHLVRIGTENLEPLRGMESAYPHIADRRTQIKRELLTPTDNGKVQKSSAEKSAKKEGNKNGASKNTGKSRVKTQRSGRANSGRAI